MQLRDRSLNLFFPTPVWSAVFEDHEAINARIRAQLDALDWEALDRENRAEFGADHTFLEDRFITTEQVPATAEVFRKLRREYRSCFIDAPKNRLLFIIALPIWTVFCWQ